MKLNLFFSVVLTLVFSIPALSEPCNDQALNITKPDEIVYFLRGSEPARSEIQSISLTLGKMPKILKINVLRMNKILADKNELCVGTVTYWFDQDKTPELRLLSFSSTEVDAAVIKYFSEKSK